MTWVRTAERRPVVCGVDIGSTNTKVVALLIERDNGQIFVPIKIG